MKESLELELGFNQDLFLKAKNICDLKGMKSALNLYEITLDSCNNENIKSKFKSNFINMNREFERCVIMSKNKLG